MDAPGRIPVIRFAAHGYPRLAISTRAITTAEVVHSDTPTGVPLARQGGRR